MATAAGSMVYKTLRITRKQKDRLQRLSEKTRVPMSVYIRDGIDFVLAKHFKQD